MMMLMAVVDITRTKPPGFVPVISTTDGKEDRWFEADPKKVNARLWSGRTAGSRREDLGGGVGKNKGCGGRNNATEVS